MRRGIRESIVSGIVLSSGCVAAKMDAADDGGGITVGASASAGEESSGAATSSGAADDGDDDAGSAGETAGAGDDEPDSPVVWDVGIPDAPDHSSCGAPSPVVCDGDGEDDPWRTIGLNCPGGPEVDGMYNGDPQSLAIHVGNLGTYNPPTYPPREGGAFLILSSGRALDLAMPGLFASTDVDGTADNGADLPEPIQIERVSPTDDCIADPGLVGAGDCSNTIEEQWLQGSGAYDYNELRFSVEVPSETFGFSYDLAMFSTEYPVFYQSGFNDMYVAWLESELWTGNISFDEMGHPISLNAGFLDYKDAPNDYDCPDPCTAPELEGTAMMGHAGTKWLTTTAGVTPGETIQVVFGVFDLSDPILDTVVLIDNFHWSCEGGPPQTIPG